MDNAFQTLIAEALNNAGQNPLPSVERTTETNNQPVTNNTQPPFRYLNRSLDTIYELLHSYNHNMTMYNNNIHGIIQLLNHNHQSFGAQLDIQHLGRPMTPMTPMTPIYTPSQPAPQTQPMTPAQTATNMIFSYLLQPLTAEEENEPRITVEQIESVTQSYDCSEEMISDSISHCPITLDAFVVGDRICEINGCNHKFKHAPLMTWFRRNAKCPVCRFNLRTNSPSATSPVLPTPTTEDFTNLLSQYVFQPYDINTITPTTEQADSDDESLENPPVD